MLTPRCQAVIVQAIGYIGTRTQAWPAGQFHALFKDARFRALEAAIYGEAEMDNIKGVQDACRAWWQYILAYRSPKVDSLALVGV